VLVTSGDGNTDLRNLSCRAREVTEILNNLGGNALSHAESESLSSSHPLSPRCSDAAMKRCTSEVSAITIFRAQSWGTEGREGLHRDEAASL
jgi:hypothetical protein